MTPAEANGARGAFKAMRAFPAVVALLADELEAVRLDARRPDARERIAAIAAQLREDAGMALCSSEVLGHCIGSAPLRGGQGRDPMTAIEIVTTLAVVDQFLRDMREHRELRGNGDDPSLPVGPFLRGLESVAEGEAQRVFDTLACLQEDAEKAARRDRPAGEAGRADA